MINYILTNIVYDGAPVVINYSSFTQNATLVIGIEGDIFGFQQNQHTGISVIFYATDSVLDVQSRIQTAAEDYVQANYNNISS
jgi:hypothetical protein